MGPPPRQGSNPRAALGIAIALAADDHTLLHEHNAFICKRTCTCGNAVCLRSTKHIVARLKRATHDVALATTAREAAHVGRSRPTKIMASEIIAAGPRGQSRSPSKSQLFTRDSLAPSSEAAAANRRPGPSEGDLEPPLPVDAGGTVVRQKAQVPILCNSLRVSSRAHMQTRNTRRTAHAHIDKHTRTSPGRLPRRPLLRYRRPLRRSNAPSTPRPAPPTRNRPHHLPPHCNGGPSSPQGCPRRRTSPTHHKLCMALKTLRRDQSPFACKGRGYEGNTQSLELEPVCLHATSAAFAFSLHTLPKPAPERI